MNELPEAETVVEQPAMLTQAQLYDDLRRIGELEDQKHAIQTEIEKKTERLRSALPQLDNASLLYQMLSAALQPTAKPQKKKKSSSRTLKKRQTKAAKRKR